MNKKLLSAWALAVTLSCPLPTLAKKTDSETAASGNPVVAIVDGRSVTLNELTAVYRQLPIKPGSFEDMFSELQSRAVDAVLMLEKAEKDKLDQDPRVQKMLTAARENTLQQAMIMRYLEKVTDAEIDAAYKAFVAELAKTKEYRVSHILFAEADRAKAEDALKKIKTGSLSFEDTAKKMSIDNLSADKGGEIGWINKNQVPAAFSEQVFKLGPDQMTDQLVKTELGLHIVKMHESRDTKAPELDKVRDLMRLQVAEKHITTDLNALRKDATVQLFDMKGKPKAEEKPATETKEEKK